MVVNGSHAAAPQVTTTAYGQIATEASSSKTTTQPINTEAAVRAYFSDIPVMIQVARCESQFRQTLPDGTVLRGVVDPHDVGVMQINTHYHAKEAAALGLNLENLHDNMVFARYLYDKQGTKPWSASETCWNPTLASR